MHWQLSIEFLSTRFTRDPLSQNNNCHLTHWCQVLLGRHTWNTNFTYGIYFIKDKLDIIKMFLSVSFSPWEIGGIMCQKLDTGLVVVMFMTMSMILTVIYLLSFVKYDSCPVLFPNNTVSIYAVNIQEEFAIVSGKVVFWILSGIRIPIIISFIHTPA